MLNQRVLARHVQAAIRGVQPKMGERPTERRPAAHVHAAIQPTRSTANRSSGKDQLAPHVRQAIPRALQTLSTPGERRPAAHVLAAVSGLAVQKAETTKKRKSSLSSRSSARSVGANVVAIVVDYLNHNQDKVAFQMLQYRGWEKWLQGELHFEIFREWKGVTVEKPIAAYGNPDILLVNDENKGILIELKCETKVEFDAGGGGFVNRVLADLGKVDGLGAPVTNPLNGFPFAELEAWVLAFGWTDVSAQVKGMKEIENASESRCWVKKKEI